MRDPTFVRLCRARDVLRDPTAGNLTLPMIAAVANMSTFHFVRAFEALFGKTPHQYRTHVRMHRARELLARGEHSVTDACMELGYASVGSFSSLFTREVGVAPAAFRRAARASISVSGFLPQDFFPGCLSLLCRLPRDAFRNFREAGL